MIIDGMLTIKKSEKRARRNRVKKAIKAGLITIVSRREMIEKSARSSELRMAVHRGEYLQMKQHEARSFFLRVSTWNSNQHVSDIRQVYAIGQRHGMSVAQKMAKEWDYLLGSSHRTTPLSALEGRFDSLITIPVARKVRPADGERLMSIITEEEVESAIKRLQRHKAPGPDRMNNIFYKDRPELLVPTLTRVYNEILQGQSIPDTFKQSIIVPLRKKGDSDSAMDYRPISLLSSAYKIMAKNFTQRMQKFWGD